jgi:serine/threonine protein phosphatase PrpC
MVAEIQFQFMVEKRTDSGEDAEPILFSTDTSIFTGVFDGMGGSGASLCTSEYGSNHTKAYVASRIIREAVNDYINKHPEKINPEDLKQVCDTRLQKEITKFPSVETKLRSKLIRNYPTTLTLAVAKEEKGNIIVDSYWAGDSRNYLWKKDGFYQITQDDLVNNYDALENLSRDSALSNCVCADNDFNINHRKIEFSKQPFVIFSATDGCFGYLPTPMHFEHLIESTLFNSDNLNSWKEILQNKIREVSGDDFSIALIAKGFKDFKDLKEILGKEKNHHIEPILTLERRIDDTRQELSELEIKLKETINSGWESYQTTYCKYINSPVDGGSKSGPTSRLYGCLCRMDSVLRHCWNSATKWFRLISKKHGSIKK